MATTAAPPFQLQTTASNSSKVTCCAKTSFADAAAAIPAPKKKITSRDANVTGQTVAASKTSKVYVAATNQAVAASKTSRVSVAATIQAVTASKTFKVAIAAMKVSVAAENKADSDA